MLENIYNFTLETFVYLKKCMANNIFVDLLSLKFLIFSLIYICNVFLNTQNALDSNIFLKIFPPNTSVDPHTPSTCFNFV